MLSRFFLILPFLGGVASALVIRHDTPTLDYENYGKETQFDATLNIFEDGNGEFGALAGSTAIDSRWGVHARHTLVSVSNWLDDGNVARIRGTRWSGVSFQGLNGVVVDQVIHYDDDFSRFANVIDIALIQSSQVHSSLRVAPVYTGWDEAGQVGSGASAANNRNNGNGVTTKPEAQETSNSNRWYEVRWAGRNQIDSVSGAAFQGSPANAILNLDFDHPTNASLSRAGGTRAIDLEYGSMNGDSGSPLYVDKDGVDGQVVGVLSGGSGNVYGSSIVYVRTRAYLNWIKDTVQANPDSRTLTMDEFSDQLVGVGGSVDLTASATSSESSSLDVIYSLVNPPVGASIDPVTGVFAWTPDASVSGTTQRITVQAQENGVVANTVTGDFEVTINDVDLVEFWSWSGGQPAWERLEGSNSYSLAGNFSYIQGDTYNSIYQQTTGTIPAGATVAVRIKLADFHESWARGGEMEFGFYDGEPSTAAPDATFVMSNVVTVPDYNGVLLADGLGNTGSNVDYLLSFQIGEAMNDPVFAVRKNFDRGRIAVDDVEVSYFFPDGDQDGIPDHEEAGHGTDPALADTDGDGLLDGAELTAGTSPVESDSDLDGYLDGYEVNVISSSPLDSESPGGPNPLAIGINFNSIRGQEANVARSLPATAYAGVPEVAQKNWNQTSALNVSSRSTQNINTIASPSAGVLVDSRGVATSVGLSYTMNNSWNINNERLTPYGSLYAGYIDTNANNNASVTLSNIPYASYDVYVYLGAGGSGSTQMITDGERTYSFSIAARSTEAGVYTESTDEGEGFPAANYVKFGDKTTSSTTVTFLRGSSNGGINAIQIVPTVQPTPYEEWATARGLNVQNEGAPTADADGDGASNLLEFVLLSDPQSAASQASLTQVTTATGSELSFIRAREIGDYEAKILWSSDLVTWSDAGLELTETEINDGETVVSASIPLSPFGHGYFRIEVSEQ